MRNKTGTTLLQTILAKPWVYRRNGRYYLRIRPVGATTGLFTISLRVNERPKANELTKDILAALAVFHLDNPEAPWADIKERLSVVALNALSMAHTDASLAAYESIYGDLQVNLSMATAHQPFTLNQHRGAIGAQSVLEAALKRLRGDSRDLVDIVDSLDGIVGDGPAASLKATREALHWDDLWPVYLKEKEGDVKKSSLDGYKTNYKQVSEALEVTGVTTKDFPEIDGHLCISIREESEGQSVKNKYSVRVVPLIDGVLGFDLAGFKEALAGPKPVLPVYHEVNNIQARKRLAGSTQASSRRTGSMSISILIGQRSWPTVRSRLLASPLTVSTG